MIITPALLSYIPALSYISPSISLRLRFRRHIPHNSSLPINAPYTQLHPHLLAPECIFSRPLRPSLPIPTPTPTTATPIFPRFIIPRHLLVRIRTGPAIPPALSLPPPPMRVAVVVPVAVVPVVVLVVLVSGVLLLGVFTGPGIRVRVGGVGGGIGRGLVARLADGAGAVVDAAYCGGEMLVGWNRRQRGQAGVGKPLDFFLPSPSLLTTSDRHVTALLPGAWAPRRRRMACGGWVWVCGAVGLEVMVWVWLGAGCAVCCCCCRDGAAADAMVL